MSDPANSLPSVDFCLTEAGTLRYHPNVAQITLRGLLDEAGENVINDVSEVGEKAIDRVSLRRSIEATAQPDDIVTEFAGDRACAVDILVVAV